MKYYSELLDDVFDSVEELEKAESFAADISDEEEMDAEKKIEAEEDADIKEYPTTKEISKKDLADAVEKSDEALKEAYALLDVANKKVQELSKAYLKETEDILKEAKQKVAEAEKNKYEAIKAFNDKYGVYKTSYTGARAAEELSRALKAFTNPRSWFDDFFNF